LFRTLPASERLDRINALSDDEAAALAYDWDWHARPKQLPPDGDWRYWLIIAGRGFGKTRTGAELVRRWVKDHDYVNLIGATSDDARDIMIEGESGILAICPDHERPRYLAHKRQLVWPNGAKSLIFTADEPERLRGKQHAKLWLDEVASWRYPESWDQAKFGLRLGDNPQAVLTTTPRPTKLIKELIADDGTHVTTGTTYENKGNLARAFLDVIVKKYEGTRLGRQELNAEILGDNPGALWKRDQIEDGRVKEAPAMKRVVVAVDPAVTSNPDSDETGIVVVGLGVDGKGYVLADLSMRGTPEEWARAAVRAYQDFKADRLLAEANNGGQMVEAVVRTADRTISYKGVHASRGKITRAEPVSALYEQGRCHHVGCFPVLEDQMCDYDPRTAKFSPDRMDALVWGFTELLIQGPGTATAAPLRM
jgi:phage terminase large subunit-like protein